MVHTARCLEIYAKNTGWSGSPFPANSEEQVAGNIDSQVSDVLQKHCNKDNRVNANRLPDPESMLEVRRALEDRHLEVSYGTC